MFLGSLHGTLKGFVKWEVLENGILVDGGHWNHNLITNYGLRAFAINGSGGSPVFSSWRNFLAVSTDTTPPTFADNTLPGEVARSSSTGGFPNSTNAFFSDNGTPGSNADDVVVLESTMVRYFNFANAQSLGSYAFFEASSGGNPTIKELFRDGVGNPVVINLQAGRELRVTHKLILKLPYRVEAFTPALEEYDADDNLINTTVYNSTGSLFTDSLTQANITAMFTNVWNPASSTAAYFITTASPNTNVGTPPGTSVNVCTLSPEFYSVGSVDLKRLKKGVVDTATGNVVFRGLTAGDTTFNNYGFKNVFTSPTSFTKANTYIMELEFEVSWQRE